MAFILQGAVWRILLSLAHHYRIAYYLPGSIDTWTYNRTCLYRSWWKGRKTLCGRVGYRWYFQSLPQPALCWQYPDAAGCGHTCKLFSVCRYRDTCFSFYLPGYCVGGRKFSSWKIWTRFQRILQQGQPLVSKSAGNW